MFKKFESYIQKHNLFSKKDRLLLALSGGIDSVVLAHLLKESGFTFSLAHANFQLRGKDSEADEKFCLALAKKLNVPIHTQRFDIGSYRKENQTGVQVAARNLRYEWFDTLLKKTKSDYLLTAHHANDVMETMFINMLRGTGINGIKGIPEKNGKIIRPLLHFEKQELLTYAQQNKIKFRLDKSNLEDHYKRNFIRLHILPKLKELNPRLEQTFINNSHHFREEASIVKDYLSEKSVDLLTQTHDGLFINKKKLRQAKYIRSLLHTIISGYGFNVSQENNILKNILSDSLSGKYFFSPTHQLYIDRNDLILKPIQQVSNDEVIITSLQELKKMKFFKYAVLKKFELPGKHEIVLHSSQLIFPLTVRKKQSGDKFKPFGMKGYKLLSEFIKNQKLDFIEKEKCRILVNGNNEIIWVIGHRSDDRYKVDIKQNNYIKLTYID